MTFSIEIDESDLTRGLFDLAVELERELHTACDRAGEVLAREGKSLAPKVTHQIEDSIHAMPVEGRWSSGTLSGGVEATSEHALPVHDGARPHRIVAVRARALAWPSGGGTRFARAVNHPGNRPNPFLELAVEVKAPEIEAVFADAMDVSFQRAGFGR